MKNKEMAGTLHTFMATPSIVADKCNRKRGNQRHNDRVELKVDNVNKEGELEKLRIKIPKSAGSDSKHPNAPGIGCVSKGFLLMLQESLNFTLDQDN